MKKIIITMILLFMNFAPLKASAYALCSSSVSCIDSISPIEMLTSMVTWLDPYSQLSYINFCMKDEENDTSVKNYSGGCNAPSDHVHFRVSGTPFVSTFTSAASTRGCIAEYHFNVADPSSYSSLVDPPTFHCDWSAGDHGFVSTNYFIALNVGDKVCIQSVGLLGPVTFGCKKRQDNTKTEIQYDSTNTTAPSCSDMTQVASRSMIPITAMVVQCVNQTIDNVFKGSSGGPSMLNVFQCHLRNAVNAALVLYTIFFGIKIALGAEMPKKGEVVMFILKMLLVLYFSVGFAFSNTCSPSGSTSSSGTYNDGITTLLAPAFFGAASSLSQMVVSASSSHLNLCVYNASDYSGLTNIYLGNSYPSVSALVSNLNMPLWDMIDCRILYYLGINSADGPGSIGLGMIGMIFPAFFSNFIFMILLLVMALLVLSISIYFAHFFIVAKIGVVIMTYMAPLFVPMSLFKQTESYYKSWLTLTVSFALQPVVVAGFIALMYTIFDDLMFGGSNGCTFSVSSYRNPFTPNMVDFFILNTHNVTTECQNSFGYVFLTQLRSMAVGNFSAFLFQIPVLNSGFISNLIGPLLSVVLYAFLFYVYSQTLSGVAAELTGGVSIGDLVTSPTAVFDKVAGGVKNLAAGAISKGKAGGGGGGAKGADNAGKMRGSDAAGKAAGSNPAAALKGAAVGGPAGAAAAVASGAASTPGGKGTPSSSSTPASSSASSITPTSSSASASSSAAATPPSPKGAAGGGKPPLPPRPSASPAFAPAVGSGPSAPPSPAAGPTPPPTSGSSSGAPAGSAPRPVSGSASPSPSVGSDVTPTSGAATMPSSEPTSGGGAQVTPSRPLPPTPAKAFAPTAPDSGNASASEQQPPAAPVSDAAPSSTPRASGSNSAEQVAVQPNAGTAATINPTSASASMPDAKPAGLTPPPIPPRPPKPAGGFKPNSSPKVGGAATSSSGSAAEATSGSKEKPTSVQRGVSQGTQNPQDVGEDKVNSSQSPGTNDPKTTTIERDSATSTFDNSQASASQDPLSTNSEDGRGTTDGGDSDEEEKQHQVAELLRDETGSDAEEGSQAGREASSSLSEALGDEKPANAKPDGVGNE